HPPGGRAIPPAASHHTSGHPAGPAPGIGPARTPLAPETARIRGPYRPQYFGYRARVLYAQRVDDIIAARDVGPGGHCGGRSGCVALHRIRHGPESPWSEGLEVVDEVPRVLAGRYEVGDLIGRGGMAEVHIGHDVRLGRTIAVKILRSDLARDPSFQNRFRREAQSAASLNHPAIVSVYDTGEDVVRAADGTETPVPFIVMEYVEGHTVRDLLQDGSALPIEEAIEITAGVLTALEYSHHASIVHRDIKPGNVMLTPSGDVKVMDFGIARAMADASSTMTQTHAVIGTAQYLSPEQARGEVVDTRSDLYSTGCLLYELLTGRP